MKQITNSYNLMGRDEKERKTSRKCNRINTKGKICKSSLIPRPSKLRNLQEWKDGRVEGTDGDSCDTGMCWSATEFILKNS